MIRSKPYTKRPFLSRRVDVIGDMTLPKRKLQATPLTKDREEWHVEYDSIGGHRAVGSLFRAGEIVRRTFNVKIEGSFFEVDIGTGSGVKIKFRHVVPGPKFHPCTCGITKGICSC